MTPKRRKFAVTGQSPVLFPVYAHLIASGYEFSTQAELADFIVVGAEFYTKRNYWAEVDSIPSRPTLLLSSSGIYSDRATSLSIRPKEPLLEHMGLVVAPVGDRRSFGRLATLQVESELLQREQPCISLRPFNVYGPNVSSGCVYNLIENVNNAQSMFIHGSGFQTRTFLHIDDFLSIIEPAVYRLLHGRFRGIFNVGSTEETTINKLAESINQISKKSTSIEYVDFPCYHSMWKLPDVTKAGAIFQWSHKTSLRQGLLYYLESAKTSCLSLSL